MKKDELYHESEERLKTPSKLQIGDDAYLYVCTDQERRVMPLSVNWLFLPCKITAVRFTPGKVYYDVSLSMELPGNKEGDFDNIRLHGVDSGLLFTTHEYCERVKEDYKGQQAFEDGLKEGLKKSAIQSSVSLSKVYGLLHEFWNRSSDACPLETSEQERQEKQWEQFINSKFVNEYASPDVEV